MWGNWVSYCRKNLLRFNHIGTEFEMSYDFCFTIPVICCSKELFNEEIPLNKALRNKEFVLGTKLRGERTVLEEWRGSGNKRKVWAKM